MQRPDGPEHQLLPESGLSDGGPDQTDVQPDGGAALEHAPGAAGAHLLRDGTPAGGQLSGGSADRDGAEHPPNVSDPVRDQQWAAL